MDVATVFAVITILASSVERIVELVSEFAVWGDPSSKDPAVIHRRAIGLWCFASLLGIAFSWLFRLDLFSILNSQQFGSASPFLRRLLSGIVIGSGTKPVHDLIAGLERFARKD